MNTKALYKLSYGLYVVTSTGNGRLNGQIANTVFQIASEPPTVAVSINKQNLTWEYISQSRAFAVSVLNQEAPLSFIGKFGFKSGRDTDKMAGVRYRAGQTGAPVVLENACSFLEARVTAELDAGTHTVFLGAVTEGDVLNDKPPMTYDYYRQIKQGTTPKSAPGYVMEKKEEESNMGKYKCTVCGWIYDPKTGDPDGGIAPGTPFEKIPDNWTCPMCGAAKSDFEPVK